MYRKSLIALLVLFLVIVVACESKQERARNYLKKLNIEFTPGSFVKSAKNSDIVAVENFLDAGMNPDIKNDAGCSAMFYAVIQKNEKMVSLLKEHGAKEVNSDGFLGKWACVNNKYFSDMKIYKEGDQYYIQTDAATIKANLRNDNILEYRLVASSSYFIEAELREDYSLAVSHILNEPLIFKRISK